MMHKSTYNAKRWCWTPLDSTSTKRREKKKKKKEEEEKEKKNIVGG